MTPNHIERILDWPPETWSDAEKRHVQEYRAQLHADLFAIADLAERENRNLSDPELERFQAAQAEFDRLGAVIPVTR